MKKRLVLLLSVLLLLLLSSCANNENIIDDTGTPSDISLSETNGENIITSSEKDVQETAVFRDEIFGILNIKSKKNTTDNSKNSNESIKKEKITVVDTNNITSTGTTDVAISDNSYYYDDNTFIISKSNTANEEIYTTVTLCGKVEVCGFDFAFNYDKSLELVSFNADKDLDIVANNLTDKNCVNVNFSASSNKIGDLQIIEFVFRKKENANKINLFGIDMKSIKKMQNNEIVNADYSVVETEVS